VKESRIEQFIANAPWSGVVFSAFWFFEVEWTEYFW